MHLTSKKIEYLKKVPKKIRTRIVNFNFNFIHWTIVLRIVKLVELVSYFCQMLLARWLRKKVDDLSFRNGSRLVLQVTLPNFACFNILKAFYYYSNFNNFLIRFCVQIHFLCIISWPLSGTCWNILFSVQFCHFFSISNSRAVYTNITSSLIFILLPWYHGHPRRKRSCFILIPSDSV